MESFNTEQEEFWAGSFGNEYISRNNDKNLHAANLNFFSQIIASTSFPIDSILELGANIGMNMKALRQLLPESQLSGLEINSKAVESLKDNCDHAYQGSIQDFNSNETFDLVFTKGVLIHLNPDSLQDTYKKMATLSSKYVLICEYYNPKPSEIDYRGHKNKLFKRDFAGEFLDLNVGFRLIDYGFSYHRDPNFSQDDISWFLMSKT